MEFVLWLVIFGIARVVKGGVENTIAILKGTEPPEITKFKSRQESGGFGSKMAGLLGRPPRKPKKDKPPKQPGAVRQVFRAWKANTAAQAVDKMNRRHQRRTAWYREHGAGIQDERWHIKQQAKLRKQQQKLEELRVRKGLVDPPEQVEGQVVEPQPEQQERLPENVASLDQAREKKGQNDGPAEQIDPWLERAKKDPHFCVMAPEGEVNRHKRSVIEPDRCQWCDKCLGGPPGSAQQDEAVKDGDQTESSAEPAQAKSAAEKSTDLAATTAASTTTSGGTGMYEAAADRLHEKAADIDSYNQDLAVFAERLATDGWGVEVTGPPADIAGSLGEAAGIMRDVANSMREQGGNVARAYEAAPFAPDKDKLVRV
ncbi:hypothetical protein ABT324_28065 [Saccharopolyspora sp. NPDC000359]|uniref:hypothetical protein n=1 Tax=Saccharopolyspora sp. NPDC000359 TaxID=3154251 RepID=UPI00331CA14A